VRNVHETRTGFPRELRPFLQWKPLHTGWFSMAKGTWREVRAERDGIEWPYLFPAFSLRLTITNTS